MLLRESDNTPGASLYASCRMRLCRGLAAISACTRMHRADTRGQIARDATNALVGGEFGLDRRKASALRPSFSADRPNLRPDLSGGDFPNDGKAGEPWSTVAA